MTLSAAALPARTPLEEELVARLRAGEIAALGELYDQHHEVVRGFSRRLVGDDQTAEDLVHETFVRLPKALARYRFESSLRSFIIAVAINHARHYVRAASRRRATAERAHLERTHLADHAQSPDHDLERRQLAELLSKALDQLSLDHRVTFVLSEVEGRSSREVATITGVPEGTVRTRLMHAKKKLRSILEEEEK